MGLDYQKYLASREWALKKEAVRKRSGGWCERCFVRDYQATHHLTYAHIGNEPLHDLLAVCNPCHEFLSAKRGTDPAKETVLLMLAVPWQDQKWWSKAVDHIVAFGGRPFAFRRRATPWRWFGVATQYIYEDFVMPPEATNKIVENLEAQAAKFIAEHHGGYGAGLLS